MSRTLKQIGAILLLVLVIVGVSGHVAHADGWFNIGSFFGLNPLQFFNQLLAYVVNSALQIMGWLLAISGFLLNLSITLTLKIKEFVDHTPAIYTTWKTLRDIAGVFMIFFLLYASIQLILGIEDPKFKSLIKNIVLVGILINFSFFFAGLGIDLSNIISVQIYNAIAPANNLNQASALLNGTGGVESTFGDGGISNLFMSKLQIPQLYDITKANAPSALGSGPGAGGLFSDTFKIILIGIIGIIIEFMAALSFAAAALAFIARFVILIFLLAFSPIWFMDMLAPEIATYTKEWKNTYKSMLIFMPVYLLLMYLAMSVLTTAPMFSSASTPVAASAGSPGGVTGIIQSVFAQQAASGGGAPWYTQYIALAVNATLVVFLLNMPLAAAASIAGKTIGLLDSASKNLGAKKWFGMAGSYASRPLGYAASQANKALEKTNIPLVKQVLGNSVLGRDLRDATLGNVAKSKFGGSRSYEDLKKERKEVGKKEAELNRGREFRQRFDDAKAGVPGAKPIKETMNRMPDKELLGLKKETLMDPVVMRHLKASHFEAIKKSDEMSEEDKAKIMAARKTVFENAITAGDPKGVAKDMIKAYKGTDLLESSALLDNPTIIPLFTTGQLKDIDDNSNDAALKARIGNAIDRAGSPAAIAAGGPRIPTYGWIQDQRAKFNTWL